MKRFWLIIILISICSCTTEVEKTNAFEDNPVVIDLKGQWVSNCVETENSSYLLTFEVNDQFISYIETFFDGATDCAPEAQGRTTYHTFEGGGAVLLSEPENAKSLDLKLKWITAKSTNESQINDWNSRSVCGINDWKMNQLEYVTGKNCEWSPKNTQGYPPIGHLFYEIYSIQEGPERLELGNNLGEQRDLRPAQFDERLYFYQITPN